MSKVLVIGPNYHNYLDAVAAAFRELGWEPFVEGFDTPVHPYSPLMRMRYKLARDKAPLRERSRRRFSEYIGTRFDALAPDLVFIINGDNLLPSVVERFRSSARVALWLFDNRAALPPSEELARKVDALFCFSRADVDSFLADGVPAHFLPQACDTQCYRPVPGCRKDIDILFIGNMYCSPRRKELMTAVAERFSDRKVVAYGWYQPWFKGPVAGLRRPYKKVFKDVNIPPQEVNLLYNRARVVLNIHRGHQNDGANPRVFEICGSGAYQVCDRNPYVESLFPDGSVGFYGSVEELFGRIDEGLAQDMSSRAADACRTVRAQHSFHNRMEEVLKLLYPDRD